MLQKLLHRYLLHRHFWREVGFDELSELYISNMLHTLAISVLMVFVPFYLYQHGYSVASIFALFGWYFAARIAFDIIAAYVVASIGPKHATIISSFFQIAAAAMLLSISQYHWHVWQIGPIWGASASFFFIALHTAFSKVKHTGNAGKEIGYLQILDKIGGVVGPLLGGVAGAFLGGQYIFVLASLILFASLWPLFRTAEPVRTHQKLDYRGLPLAKIKYDLISYVGLGIENSLCINLWPLYISLFALSGAVYLQLGALSSVSVFVAIISTYAIGKIADKGNARRVMRLALISNFLVYLFRPFVGNLVSALAVNVANETITIGYRLPYTKGFYAAADDLPGHRIVYISSMEMVASTVKATAWFFLAILALTLAPKYVLFVGFAIAACGSLLTMSERFAALTPRKGL